MRRFTICLIVLCLTLFSGLALAQGTEKEKAAITAAEQWLSLVDSGKYGKSWKQAAENFRGSVSKVAWRDSMMAARKSLGRLKSRSVLNSDYKTSLPGAPDGEYVIIQFETSFENKQTAVETVTPMLEKDGSWRVCGYYIK
ncbi:MAG: hypothetical protein BA871_13930 [Desulfuromonadales bacterium C00003096]|jgi:hypothetical protein|nr:MAG: hypothetical protein BA871_13930 [Desulfuromonadales bacterium C00003096]